MYIKYAKGVFQIGFLTLIFIGVSLVKFPFPSLALIFKVYLPGFNPLIFKVFLPSIYVQSESLPSTVYS